MIIITGSTGLIGSSTSEYFLNKGIKVIGIDNDLRAYFFGKTGSNKWKEKKLKENKLYSHFNIDIRNKYKILNIFKKYSKKIKAIIHTAAQPSHDWAAKEPFTDFHVNATGTLNLLEGARTSNENQACLFYQISTDEVFGSLGEKGVFDESTAYAPHSPYSASKASSDHFVRAYGETYGLPYIISNCSNNYGPGQHDEKLIPTVISSVLKNELIPVYGTGANVRDWLYVKDHVRAIDTILHQGKIGETYCIGGGAELSNLELVHLLVDEIDRQLGNAPNTSKALISFVEDRKGHDFRYAIDHSKLTDDLSWKPTTSLEKGLETTVSWYLNRAK